MACFLMHNFIRSQMDIDPIEMPVGNSMDDNNEDEGDQDGIFVDNIQASTEWSLKRDSWLKPYGNNIWQHNE